MPVCRSVWRCGSGSVIDINRYQHRVEQMKIQMKHFLAAVILFSGVSLYARVAVGLSFNREVYMRYEHIYACVTLRNDSGRPLLFGGDPALQGFLLFDIRDSKNRPIYARKNSELSVTGLLLAPGETRQMIFRLDQHYKLDRTGRYRVHAYVSHNQLKNEFRSKDVEFEISNGSKVWSRTVGLPDLDGVKRKPDEDHERTYTIRSLTERKSIGYYLVVEGADKVYGVCRIGHVVGYEKFQAEVDMLSRLHLLLPVDSRIFHYLAFNYAGDNLESSYWRTSDTIPSLVRDSKNGYVRRMGGIRVRPGTDFVIPDRIGKVSVTRIIDESMKKQRPPRHSGTVDLGKGVMADAPGTRNRE